MLIKELIKINKKLGLYMSYSNFHMEGVLCRRLVLQKNSMPHMISEDYEVYKNGEWISP